MGMFNDWPDRLPTINFHLVSIDNDFSTCFWSADNGGVFGAFDDDGEDAADEPQEVSEDELSDDDVSVDASSRSKIYKQK